jgi:hypothetical protein
VENRQIRTLPGNRYLKSALPSEAFQIDPIFGRTDRGSLQVHAAAPDFLEAPRVGALPGQISGPQIAAISMILNDELSGFWPLRLPEPWCVALPRGEGPLRIWPPQPPCAAPERGQKSAAAQLWLRFLNSRERSPRLLMTLHKKAKQS